MFGLFEKKSTNCEKCLMPLGGRYHVFSPMPWAKDFFSYSKKIKLCTPCMMKKYKEYLHIFTGKAVVIEPMKNYIAFPYYTFKEILEDDYWPKDGVIELKNLLNQEGSCVECEKKANYLLCSPEIYKNNPTEPFDIKNNMHSKKFLCADCLCNRLEKIIVENNLYFNAVYPIMDGDGVATSFNP